MVSNVREHFAFNKINGQIVEEVGKAHNKQLTDENEFYKLVKKKICKLRGRCSDESDQITSKCVSLTAFLPQKNNKDNTC